MFTIGDHALSGKQQIDRNGLLTGSSNTKNDWPALSVRMALRSLKHKKFRPVHTLARTSLLRIPRTGLLLWPASPKGRVARQWRRSLCPVRPSTSSRPAVLREAVHQYLNQRASLVHAFGSPCGKRFTSSSALPAVDLKGCCAVCDIDAQASSRADCTTGRLECIGPTYFYAIRGKAQLALRVFTVAANTSGLRHSDYDYGPDGCILIRCKLICKICQ
jgi:hypothetical protein